jgi:hypothetical protein
MGTMYQPVKCGGVSRWIVQGGPHRLIPMRLPSQYVRPGAVAVAGIPAVQ